VPNTARSVRWPSAEVAASNTRCVLVLPLERGVDVVVRFFDRAIAPRLRTRRPEDPRPLRFANALGATFLAVALLLHSAGLATAGWAAAGLVAALALLGALTGFCVGCRFYWVISALRRTRRLS